MCMHWRFLSTLFKSLASPFCEKSEFECLLVVLLSFVFAATADLVGELQFAFVCFLVGHGERILSLLGTLCFVSVRFVWGTTAFSK